MPEGGKRTDLTPSVISRITQAARYVISGVTPDAWFGPMQPLQPMAPADVAGRRFDYPTGYNLDQHPRSYEPISFTDLRALADNCDILRSVIETRKDQMEALEWVVRPRREENSYRGVQQITPEQKARVEAVTMFFNKPDKVTPWGQWLRMLLEDMFVIDAVSIYKRRDRGSRLYALELIDGASIKPLLDEGGRIPLAPDPGYQQILKGIPAVDYTTDELLYLKHNPRSNKVYGYSHVEQVVVTVNIMLRRTLHQLDYYKEGTQPDAFASLPKEWNTEQIKAFQTHFDAMMAGNLAMRRRLKFVPGEFKYQETKAPPLKDEYDEFLARIICFIFSIPPTPFVKETNRATAQTAYETARQEGLAPLQLRVKNIINPILAEEFGSPDLEFAWADDRGKDPEKAATIIGSYVDRGIISINEARERIGEESIEGAADELMVRGASGYVPVGYMPPEPSWGGGGGSAEAAASEDEKVPAREQNGEKDEKKPESSRSGTKDENPEGKHASAHALRKRGGIKPVPFPRKETRTAAAKLTKKMQKAMKATAKDVADQVRASLSKVSKADDIAAEEAKKKAIAIAKELDLSGMDVLVDLMQKEIADIASDTASRTIVDIGLINREDLVNVVNDRAVVYARKRSAEMIGKRYDADGNLVDSRNADMVITDTMRDSVRDIIANGLEDGLGSDDIADLIEAEGPFSPERAELIANTEIARANSQGALMGMQEAKDAGVVIKKSWYCDAEACDICQANADQGPIDLDEEFDSGDDTPPGHPRCECVLMSEVEDGPITGGDGSGGEDDAGDE